MPTFNSEVAANLIRITPVLQQLAEEGDLVGLLYQFNLANVSREDHTPYTAKYLIKRFGVETAGAMIAGFKGAADANPLMAQIWLALGTIGLDFADDDVQANIDMLVQANTWQQYSATFGDMLKRIGRWNVSIAEQAFGETITEEQLDEAIVVYDRFILADQVTQRYNLVRQQVDAGEILTWDAARIALGAE